jgi:outer membrane protein
MPLYKHGWMLLLLLVRGTPIFSVSNCHAETLEQAWDVAIGNNHQIKSVRPIPALQNSNCIQQKANACLRRPVASGYTQLNESPAAKAHFLG